MSEPFFSTVYPFRSFLPPLGRTCTPSIAAALLMWKVVFPFIGWVLGGIGVIVGAILIWKFVLPFIGFVFQPIWRFLSALLNRHEHKRQRPGS